MSYHMTLKQRKVRPSMIPLTAQFPLHIGLLTEERLYPSLLFKLSGKSKVSESIVNGASPKESDLHIY